MELTQFFSKVFLEILHGAKEEGLVSILDLKGERPDLNAQFRAVRRARLLAEYLLDEKGELKKKEFQNLLESWEKASYCVYPGGESDIFFTQRVHDVLKKLKSDDSFYRKIKKFHHPVCNHAAEEIIRASLGYDSSTPLDDADVRKAVLAACFVPLRQSRGSCFATAPAILVQAEQMEQFLNDLYELLTTGRLKRVSGGHELAVPLSPFTKKSDHEIALLKAWEFTLASFCDVKMEFSKWNLYIGLGLDMQEEGGIGELIYRHLDGKLGQYNAKIEEYQKDYEIAFDQVRATEALLKRASTEIEIRRLQAEYQGRAYHMHVMLEMRDKVYAEAGHLSNLFSFLLKQYEEKIPHYFQEIYDPEMQDPKYGDDEDSPAGFRLVYKHGRGEASLWTPIYSREQYIEALVNFFHATDHEISSACTWEEGKREIGLITSEIITILRTQEFIEGAILRIAKAHGLPYIKNPLEELEHLSKKPWAYISGGTLENLIRYYFKREGEIARQAQWVEKGMELAEFIVESVKQLSTLVTTPFLHFPQKRMLMNSPTHAFLLQPGSPLFRVAWQDNTYTYSWIRDHVLNPGKAFYEKIALDEAAQMHLVDLFADQLPIDLAHKVRRGYSPFHGHLSVLEFRQVLEAHLPLSLAPFLYETLPLTPGNQWKEKVRTLFGDLCDEKLEAALHKLPDAPSLYLTSKEMQELAKACFLLAQGKIVLSFDLHGFVAKRARDISLAPPEPLLFADTNWPETSFAFVVNPGTLHLEFWRVNRTATSGSPLPHWQPYLDGTKKIPWVLFTRPSDYTSLASLEMGKLHPFR